MSRKSEGNIESQGETRGGDHSEAQRRGQGSRSYDSQHKGHRSGGDRAGGSERNGQRRQAGAQWRGMRGQREGNYSAERNRNGGPQRNRERYWLKYSPDNN